MTQDSSPSNALPPQRSTRAPAEGADPREDRGFDHAPADHGEQPRQRSPREPAEGKPDAAQPRSGPAAERNPSSDGPAERDAQAVDTPRPATDD